MAATANGGPAFIAQTFLLCSTTLTDVVNVPIGALVPMTTHRFHGLQYCDPLSIRNAETIAVFLTLLQETTHILFHVFREDNCRS